MGDMSKGKARRILKEHKAWLKKRSENQAKRMWAVLRFLGLCALILFCEWTATFFVLTAPQHAANVWAAGAYEGFWTGAGARRLLAQAVAGGGLAEFARRVLLETAAGGGVGGTAPAFAFTEAGTWAVNSATASVVYGMVDSHALMTKQLAGYDEWWPFCGAGIQAGLTTIAAVGIERGSHSEGWLSPIDWPTSFRFAILTSRAFTKLLEAACCHWPLTSWRGALTAVLLALGNVGVLTLGATLGARYGPLALIICTIVLEAVSMAAKRYTTAWGTWPTEPRRHSAARVDEAQKAKAKAEAEAKAKAKAAPGGGARRGGGQGAAVGGRGHSHSEDDGPSEGSAGRGEGAASADKGPSSGAASSAVGSQGPSSGGPSSADRLKIKQVYTNDLYTPVQGGQGRGASAAASGGRGRGGANTPALDAIERGSGGRGARRGAASRARRHLAY